MTPKHLLLAALMGGALSLPASAAPAPAKAPAKASAKAPQKQAQPAEAEEKSGSGQLISSSGGDLRPGEKPLTRDEYYACLVDRRTLDADTRKQNQEVAALKARVASFKVEQEGVRGRYDEIEKQVSAFNQRRTAMEAANKAALEAAKGDREALAKTQKQVQETIDAFNRDVTAWRESTQAASPALDAAKKALDEQVPLLNAEQARVIASGESVQKRDDELRLRCDDKAVNEGDYYAAHRRLKKADEAAAAAQAGSAASAPQAASAPAAEPAKAPAKGKPKKK